jgi:hypothetical protein
MPDSLEGKTEMSGVESKTLLQARGIAKAFAGVQALKGVDFDVRAGEVHALMGDCAARCSIARLARNQLEVIVFLDRLGEPFNARPRIRRACLTFNLSDFSAVRVELMKEFRCLGPDCDLVGSNVTVGAFGSRIINDDGGNIISWPPGSPAS